MATTEKPVKNIFTELDVFNAANSFYEARNAVCDKMDESKNFGIYIAPVLTLDAFCIELYLKCLYFIENAKPFRENIHDLYGIYERLSIDSRLCIQVIYAMYIQNNHEYWDSILFCNPTDIKFQDELKTIKDTFMNWRYFYEKKPNTFRTGVAILEAIRDMIFSLRPEWKND